jgi:hypothetical protein
VAGEIAAGLPLPKGRARAANTLTEQAEGAAETTQPDAWNATRSPGDKSGTVRLIDRRFGR